MTTENQAPEGGPALAEVCAFLDGSAPLEGVWFGDRHPTKPGAFWWRSALRAALAAQPTDNNAVGKARCYPAGEKTTAASAEGDGLPPPPKKFSPIWVAEAGCFKDFSIFIREHLENRDDEWRRALETKAQPKGLSQAEVDLAEALRERDELRAALAAQPTDNNAMGEARCYPAGEKTTAPAHHVHLLEERLDGIAQRARDAGWSVGRAEDVAPAMQEEIDRLVATLAACRDAFPIPEKGTPHEDAWMLAMGHPAEVPSYVRAALAAATQSHAVGAEPREVRHTIKQAGAVVCNGAITRYESPSCIVLEMDLHSKYCSLDASCGHGVFLVATERSLHLDDSRPHDDMTWVEFELPAGKWSLVSGSVSRYTLTCVFLRDAESNVPVQRSQS